MLHFSGYSAWTMDEIKKYHAPTMDGIAAGHPEIEYPGCEVTTGPLGQGISNAVGMAMAGKNLAATYNKDGYDVVSGKVWCFTGDGCLQEGVGQEGELTSILLALQLILFSHLHGRPLWSRQPDPHLRQ
jgi:dihydroxyacetone synthase